MFCECGNHGPEERQPGTCYICWLKKWHPDKLPRERQRPGFAAQAKSAVRAATRFAAAGMPIADAETVANRKTICSACEHLRNGRCDKCGCALFLKQRMATEHCPIGKW